MARLAPLVGLPASGGSAGGVVHGVAAVPRDPRRHQPAGAGGRGSALGRPGDAGVLDPPAGVGGRGAAGDHRHHPARSCIDTAPSIGAPVTATATTLTLFPLSDVENAQLVTSLLGTPVLPADLHAALLAKSAGNPLYTREYLNMLTDQTELDRRPGLRPRVGSLADTLPGSVQAVIAARLDTLPARAQAAVAGRGGGRSHASGPAPSPLLTDTDQAAVSARLHDLVRRDYLRPSRSSSIAGEPEYTFSHALIADVAYHQLPRAHPRRPPSTRRRLARRPQRRQRRRGGARVGRPPSSPTTTPKPTPSHAAAGGGLRRRGRARCPRRGLAHPRRARSPTRRPRVG